MNRYIEKVGEHTKSIRTALGLTQEDFAKKFNRKAPVKLVITRILVSKYERGEVRMPADKYLKMKDMNPEGNDLI